MLALLLVLAAAALAPNTAGASNHLPRLLVTSVAADPDDEDEDEDEDDEGTSDDKGKGKGKGAKARRPAGRPDPRPTPAPQENSPQVQSPVVTLGSPATATLPAATPAPATTAQLAIATAPRMLSPFPVVRIKGRATPWGARITLLSVRAPLGARVRVRCFGRGCPLRHYGRRARTSAVRVYPFQRHLAAGVILEVRVTRGDEIGKYTRFRIRRGAPPKRRDLCLPPFGARPQPCG